ncbi:Hypothetical protein PBC10988_12690 [Planctomycetales bacterium 10988]|nr:Hypothetical protein PBC10988_12690 [Planctomycetales bacterium 10988]
MLTSINQLPRKRINFNNIFGLFLSLFLIGIMGCGAEEKPLSDNPLTSERGTVSEESQKILDRSQSQTTKQHGNHEGIFEFSGMEEAVEDARRNRPSLNSPRDPSRSPEAILPSAKAPHSQSQPLDEAAIWEAGIQRYEGKHVTIYSDAPRKHIEDLPKIFDLAYQEWCDYFDLPPALPIDGLWKIRAHVLANPESRPRFEKVGLLPQEVPPFANGYAQTKAIWIYDQAIHSEYYQRHLLIHEGTHAFMLSHFGQCDAAWYTEGMAELLGTHHWDGEELQLAYFPQSKEEVPYWGRISLVQDEVESGRSLDLGGVTQLSISYQEENRAYAWCWALCALLENDPAYRDRFREMAVLSGQDTFKQQFRAAWQADAPRLAWHWQLFQQEIAYGYDFGANQLNWKTPRPLISAESVQIQADQGWQSSGFSVQEGQTIRLAATGRFQIADQYNGQAREIFSEAGGVTFRYYDNQPLGTLLLMVFPEAATLEEVPPFQEPTAVGIEREWTAKRSGTLWLKVNDSPAERNDNQGTPEIEMQPLSTP